MLDAIYALLHPFMPFLSEELWAIKGQTGPARDGPLALGPWPREGLEVDESVGAEIGWVVDLIGEIRSVKSEMGIPPATAVPLLLVAPTETIEKHAADWSESIKRLARVERIETCDAAPPGALQLIVRDHVVALPLGGIVDLTAERARLDKEIDKVRLEISKVEAKLGNQDFLARAPDEVIAEHEERREAFQERLAKLSHARERLDRL